MLSYRWLVFFFIAVIIINLNGSDGFISDDGDHPYEEDDGLEIEPHHDDDADPAGDTFDEESYREDDEDRPPEGTRRRTARFRRSSKVEMPGKPTPAPPPSSNQAQEKTAVNPSTPPPDTTSTDRDNGEKAEEMSPPVARKLLDENVAPSSVLAEEVRNENIKDNEATGNEAVKSTAHEQPPVADMKSGHEEVTQPSATQQASAESVNSLDAPLDDHNKLSEETTTLPPDNAASTPEDVLREEELGHREEIVPPTSTVLPVFSPTGNTDTFGSNVEQQNPSGDFVPHGHHRNVAESIKASETVHAEQRPDQDEIIPTAMPSLRSSEDTSSSYPSERHQQGQQQQQSSESQESSTAVPGDLSSQDFSENVSAASNMTSDDAKPPTKTESMLPPVENIAAHHPHHHHSANVHHSSHNEETTTPAQPIDQHQSNFENLSSHAKNTAASDQNDNDRAFPDPHVHHSVHHQTQQPPVESSPNFDHLNKQFDESPAEQPQLSTTPTPPEHSQHRHQPMTVAPPVQSTEHSMESTVEPSVDATTSLPLESSSVTASPTESILSSSELPSITPPPDSVTTLTDSDQTFTTPIMSTHSLHSHHRHQPVQDMPPSPHEEHRQPEQVVQEDSTTQPPHVVTPEMVNKLKPGSMFAKIRNQQAQQVPPAEPVDAGIREEEYHPPVEVEAEAYTVPPQQQDQPDHPLSDDASTAEAPFSEHQPQDHDLGENISEADSVSAAAASDVPVVDGDTGNVQDNHSLSHHLLDDILEHYLDALPLSAKTFFLSQPFGLSLSTTLMATLIPVVVFLWSSFSLLMSFLFTPRRIGPKVDLEYVRNMEAKFFSMEKEYKELKKAETEFLTGGGAGSGKSQAEVDAMKTELAHLRGEIGRLNGLLNDEQLSHAEVSRELHSLREENARQNKLISSWKEKFAETDASIQNKEEHISVLTAQLQQLESSIATQNDSLQQAFSENEALRLQLSSRDEEIGQITKQYAQLEDYCTERVREYEALYKSFSELEVLQASDVEDEMRDERLKSLADSSKLRAELDKTKTQMEELQDELDTAKNALSILDEKVSQLRDENVEVKRLETSAQQEKREAETKLTVLSEYFTTRELELQKQIGEESVWRKHGENQTDSLSKKVVNLEAEVKSHRDQVEYLKNELSVVEQTHKAALAREEKKALESWASARSLERQLKEAQADAQALRQQLTNAVTGANKGGTSGNPSFIPPPPGLIPPMPPHLLQPPPPPWALRPPSDRSSQDASSPRAAESSLLQSSASERSAVPGNATTSPQRSGPPLVPPQPSGLTQARPGGHFIPPGAPSPSMVRGPMPTMPPPPAMAIGTHGFMSTPPTRPGVAFPPRPGMATFPTNPHDMAARLAPAFPSNHSAHLEDNDSESGSETGSTGSSSGSDDEELRTLAAAGGQPQFPPNAPPPFMPQPPNAQFFQQAPPPPGAQPGQFFPPPLRGQMPPFQPGSRSNSAATQPHLPPPPPQGMTMPPPQFNQSAGGSFFAQAFPPPPMGAPPFRSQVNPGLGP